MKKSILVVVSLCALSFVSFAGMFSYADASNEKQPPKVRMIHEENRVKKLSIDAANEEIDSIPKIKVA